MLQIWRLYLALPTPLTREFADQRKKQKDYLAVRHELNATSSQDEFAKWAKLRRQHDKLLDELEKKSRATKAACRYLMLNISPQNPASKPPAPSSTATSRPPG